MTHLRWSMHAFLAIDIEGEAKSNFQHRTLLKTHWNRLFLSISMHEQMIVLIIRPWESKSGGCSIAKKKVNKRESLSRSTYVSLAGYSSVFSQSLPIINQLGGMAGREAKRPPTVVHRHLLVIHKSFMHRQNNNWVDPIHSNNTSSC